MYNCQEEWVDITGFEGKYQISNHGRIKSLARLANRGKGNYQPLPEKIKNQHIDKAGYPIISLWNDFLKKGKRFRMHRIIAKHFILNPDSKPCVNHKDGDKTNNFFENLEWCTYGENKSHSFKVLGERHWLKDKFGEDCPYHKKVDMLDLTTNEVIKTFYGLQEASRKTGAGQGNIWSVCNGKRPHAKGFGWRYSYVL